ncbi:MAG: right-handed parallel beta-helix repeat-containing protein [Planctomycetes bacterium]|nr:right-handed parallel beta-helix repeat-containing protein [Planctomycetota bacterium]
MRRTILLLGLSLWLACASAHAETYHVSTAGHDGNPGSAAFPWLTLQRAANVMQPGDTVQVADGTYAGFLPARSGSPGAPIRYKSTNPRGAKINAPSPIAAGDDALDFINIQAKSYLIVEGFEVSGAPRAGISVRSIVDSSGEDTANVEIRNCRSRNNGSAATARNDGIYAFFAKNLRIEDCETHANTGHGILIVGGGSDAPVVRHCVSYSNGLHGIALSAFLAGGGDGNITGFLAEQNRSDHNAGAGLQFEGASGGICQNNLVYRNALPGLNFIQGAGAVGSHTNLVVNNTVYHPTSTTGALVVGNGSNNLTIFNNLLYSGTGAGLEIQTASNTQHDYNTFNSITGGAQSSHELTQAPGAVFSAPATDDLTLKDGSPAIDSGIDTFNNTAAPNLDFNRASRPFGAKHDRGAYERGAPLDTTPPGITILVPSLSPVFTTNLPTVSLAGSAGDNAGLALLSWENSLGGFGVIPISTNWNVANIPLELGQNVLTLRAVDTSGLTAFDTLTVTRLPPPNLPPVIESGPLATPDPLLLPATADLLVTASDPDEAPDPLVYTWVRAGGPASVDFEPNATEDADQSVATFSAPGVYQLRTSVFDGADATEAEFIYFVSDGTVPGPVTDTSLCLTKGQLSVNFARSGSDKLLLTGRFNRALFPDLMTGIEATLVVNGATVLNAQPLDALGRFASPRGEKPVAKSSFATKTGIFTLSLSSADLAAVLNPPNRTGSSSLLVDLVLHLEGGGLGAPIEARGAFEFLGKGKKGASFAASYLPGKGRAFDGFLSVTKAAVTQLSEKAGGGHKVTLAGNLDIRGAEPFILRDEALADDDVRIELGGETIELSFISLLISGITAASASYTYNPQAPGGPPELKQALFSNVNKSYKLTTNALDALGLPPAGPAEALEQVLPFALEFETLSGRLRLETQIRLRRTKPTATAWK